MRFKEYINEAAADEIKIVSYIIEPKVKLLYKFLKSNKWITDDKEITDILNILFKNKDIPIVFDISREKNKIYRYISGGEVEIGGGEIVITVHLQKGISEFFKRFAKPDKDKMFLDMRKNQFFSDLLNILSHEFKHLTQIRASDIKATFIDPSDLDPKDYHKYTGSDVEIDSFAFQAAIEFLKYGKHGGVYKMYKKTFEVDDSRYKKFLKKLESYKSKLKKMKLDKILKV